MLVMFILADGTTFGIGTKAELAALIADGIVPPTATTRPVTRRDTRR